MSEPSAAGPAVANESGGPPIEPPVIGSGKGTEKPAFAGFDGKTYTQAMPAGKPRQPRRRALPAGLTPEEGAAPDKAVTAQPGTAPGAQPPATPPAPTPTERPTGLEALRRPGETDAEFFPRLHAEDRARIQKLQHRSEQALQQAAGEIQRLQGMLEPLLRAHYKQEQEAAQRAQAEAMARLPSPEAEPEAYRTLLAEETYRNQLLWQEQQREREEAAQRQAAERQQQEALEAYFADRDTAIQAEMSSALEADPGLGEVLYKHLQFTADNLRWKHPDASDEDIEQAVFLTHLADLVKAKERGVPLADYLRTQGELASRVFGGNGHQPPPPAAAPPAAVPESPQMGDAPQIASPTAARVAREAARAGAAAPISAGGGPGRPGGVPGEGLLPTKAFRTEEEYVRAGIKGEFDENWIRDSLGRAAGGRGRRRYAG